ncbi:GtrA family protein [Pantoea agglomerans]|uniref:GtrA family protein n=1 Tax=Enterobacter agglomerans TaxID=549 RepID=UPI0010651F5B|nr:GtrA family protein [Pantoea agglomerans]WNK68362.1 GtrA family protein [Pantoea agglomerans]
MAKLFARYMTIGVLNTLIHWVVFAICIKNDQSQSVSNFIAFCVAVTFSFFANAKWTFKSDATTFRYMMYVFFMGAVATLIGASADRLHINPVATLVVFSAVSLVCGFLYSKYIIFREKS